MITMVFFFSQLKVTKKSLQEFYNIEEENMCK